MILWAKESKKKKIKGMFCKDESPLSPVSALRENQTSAGFLATQQNQKYVGTAGRETGDEQSRASLHFLLYVAS